MDVLGLCVSLKYHIVHMFYVCTLSYCTAVYILLIELKYSLSTGIDKDIFSHCASYKLPFFQYEYFILDAKVIAYV